MATTRATLYVMTYEQYSAIGREVLGAPFSLGWRSFRKKPVKDLQKKYNFQPRKVAAWAQVFLLLTLVVSFLVVLPVFISLIIFNPFGVFMDSNLPYVVAVIPTIMMILTPFLIAVWLIFNPMTMWLFIRTGIVTMKTAA